MSRSFGAENAPQAKNFRSPVNLNLCDKQRWYRIEAEMLINLHQTDSTRPPQHLKTSSIAPRTLPALSFLCRKAWLSAREAFCETTALRIGRLLQGSIKTQIPPYLASHARRNDNGREGARIDFHF